MSETPEARSSPPEKERGHLRRPRKHILEPVQNGQTLENVAPTPDIAEDETVKLATPGLNGKAQDGKPASSASSNGHQIIEETETIKLATPGLNGKAQGGKPASSAASNGHQVIEETETVKLAAAPGPHEDRPPQRPPQGGPLHVAAPLVGVGPDASSPLVGVGPDASSPLVGVGPRAQLSQQILVRAVYPLRQLNRLRRYSLLLFAIVLFVPLIILLLGGILEYAQLQQPFDNLYTVDALSGAVQGQIPVTLPIQPLATDNQGSLLSVTTGQHLQQLAAYGLNGAPQWHSLTTPYTFSIPALSSHPGSLLVAAGDPLPSASGAPMRPLALYQVKRATGAVIWQKTLLQASDQAVATILGADQRAVYVATVQTGTRASAARPVVVLQAISQDSGAVIWSVTGPTAANDAFQDAGHLLLSGTTVFWQVAGSIYAIKAAQGQVQWSHLIPENGNQELVAEESHMLVVGNTLIIERAVLYHALDVTSGNEQWDVSNPGQQYSGQPGNSGIAAGGNTLLLYGGGQIVALDAATRQVLWTQKQLDSVQNVVVADDGKLVYVVLTDSVEGSQPAQALVALDIQNGGARWTFQTSNQMSFLSLLPGGFAYTGHVLLAAICLLQQASCVQPLLYALNPANGAILWKVGGNSISAITISSAGDVLLFQRHSTGWLDLTTRFKS